MSKSSIKNKIRIIVVLLSLSITAIGVLGVLTSNSLLNITNSVVEERFPNYAYLRDIGIDIHQVLLKQKALFHYPISSKEYKEAIKD